MPGGLRASCCRIAAVDKGGRMTLPPMWKVRRELRAGFTKLSMLFIRTVHDPIRKVIYDRRSNRLIKITPGELTLTDRVAVFVVFQPNGLAPSLQLTLDHLARNRFSVVLVSNGPLRPDDRTAVAKSVSVLLERPNVGYDFGGYRDGIRYLWSLRQELSLLVLMNDSTWFPLRRDDDSLARMEALGADLAGHVFKTENEKRPDNDHIESHMLMISKDFVRSSDFRQFWSRYVMSNSRVTTIRVGEKAFTQCAIRSGWRVGSILDRQWLMSVLQKLDDADLELVLQHTIDIKHHRHPDLSTVRRCLASGEPWREAFLAWTDHSLRNSLPILLSAAFVMPAHVYGRMGFAKKAKDMRFHMAREELLDLEASGMIPPLADEVRAEVSQMVRGWVPPNGQARVTRPRIAQQQRVIQ